MSEVEVVVKRPTLRDVSREAGVSTYTASQALSGKAGVSETTRERILQVAQQIGYVPNRLAATLKGETSRSIGILTASGRNQYYAMLVQAIDTVLQGHGFHAVTNDAMRTGTYDLEREKASVEELLQQRVAAVVATYSLGVDSMSLLETWGIPVVFVDSPPPAGYERHPFIGSNNYEGSAKVGDYLHSLGLRTAMVLGFPPEWNTRRERQRGFVETAERHGMSVEILESENSAAAAAEVIEARFSQPIETWPESVYALNTVLLQGALTSFRKLGITVPDEVSVVGFDEFDWSELIAPPITVVDQHIDQIGETAGQALIEIVDKGASNRGSSRVHVEIEPSLIVRESCSFPRIATSAHAR